MRLKSLLAAAAAVICAGLSAPNEASAGGLHRDHATDGWGHSRVVRHRLYHPHYSHHYKVDPYAYQYSPRGYYPYYDAGYWRPTAELRKRKHVHYHHWNVQPPRFKYYPSWGYPKHWHHKEWHEQHHGGHFRWHW